MQSGSDLPVMKKRKRKTKLGYSSKLFAKKLYVKKKNEQEKQTKRQNALQEIETNGDKMARIVADRLHHQLYLNEESQEEVEVRKELNREQTVTNRETENEEETEERREENLIRMERLREEREETEELMQAMDAFEHAEMIPLETDEERSH
jgi:hypothetical protein